MVAAQFANQIQNLEDRMLAKGETLRVEPEAVVVRLVGCTARNPEDIDSK
jgi:hypothetical protein